MDVLFNQIIIVSYAIKRIHNLLLLLVNVHNNFNLLIRVVKLEQQHAIS